MQDNGGGDKRNKEKKKNMKIYLWFLHVGGLLMVFMSGMVQSANSWSFTLVLGALSIVALWAILSKHSAA